MCDGTVHVWYITVRRRRPMHFSSENWLCGMVLHIVDTDHFADHYEDFKIRK